MNIFGIIEVVKLGGIKNGECQILCVNEKASHF